MKRLAHEHKGFQLARAEDGRKGLTGKAGSAARSLMASGHEVRRLKVRVAELEREMQEVRRLNRRLAEITDVVEELLLPAAQRNEEVLAKRLEDFGRSR